MTLALFLQASFVWSQKVSLETAFEYARVWANSKSTKQVQELIFSDSLFEDNKATVYRFKMKPQGFILMSADLRTPPVLAYSFDFNLTDDESHPGNEYIRRYHREIRYVQEELSIDLNAHTDWSFQPSKLKGLKTDQVVEPMMEVAWGQGSGYNQFTPANTPTGCVAVAMVQMMRHWEWPKKGKGQHSYTHDTYGEFSIDLDTVSFDWANMPLTSPSEDIARAMLYTGYALHMNYAPDGSGANTERAGNLMESSFGFHEKGRYISLSDFGNMQNWTRVVKNEMINQRPVIYRGQGTGGHAFNFDGLDGDYFHINWGWSGSYNGYFLLSSLTPGSNNFSEGQGAVVNLFPDSLLLWDRPFGIRVLASDAKVSLAWDGVFNSELAHYNIYRDGAVIGQANQRIFTDETAENGNFYAYSVSAVYRTDTADYESEKTAEVMVEPAADFAVPYAQDFESGHPGWLIANSNTGFQWGTAAELGMGSDDTNHVIGINSGAAGNKVVSDYMISNGFDFAGLSHVVFSFDYAFRKWQDVDHLYLMYKVFEDNKWIEFAEIEPTKGYTDWARYEAYLPTQVLKNNVQIAFYYTDNGEIGYGALIDNVSIYKVENPGVPDFQVSVKETCLNSELVFTDNSSGTKDSYYWDFGAGASPKTAETAGPHTVTYNTGGTKTITLILNNLDETTKVDFVEVVRPPSARFSKSINYKTVSFTNTSSNATNYLWDFGDGIKDSQENPVHVYSLSGDYIVKLVAMNFVCENDTIEQKVSFKITGEENFEIADALSVYPNPADEFLNISLTPLISSKGMIEIFNLEGRKVLSFDLQDQMLQPTIRLNVSELAKGTYFIRFIGGDKILRSKFLKMN